MRTLARLVLAALLPLAAGRHARGALLQTALEAEDAQLERRLLSLEAEDAQLERRPL